MKKNNPRLFKFEKINIRIFLNFRKIAATVAVILFIGVISLAAVNTDHHLVIPLFLSSYLLSLLCAIISRRLRISVFFLVLAAVLPPMEFFFIGSENFDAYGVLINPEKHGIFIHGGNLGVASLSYVIPGIVGMLKTIHYILHSMSRVGNRN